MRYAIPLDGLSGAAAWERQGKLLDQALAERNALPYLSPPEVKHLLASGHSVHLMPRRKVARVDGYKLYRTTGRG